MHGKSKIFLILILVITIHVAAGFTSGAEKAGYKTPILMARLTDNAEIQQPDSAARGSVVFHLSDDGKKLYYRLDIGDVNNVTAAHIRLGSKDDPGRVVVILFDIENPWTSSISHVTVEGVITGDNLIGPLYGLPLDALLTEIEKNYALVNISTADSSDGQIRGQIIYTSNY